MPAAVLALLVATYTAAAPLSSASLEARAAVRLCLSLDAPAEEGLAGCRQAVGIGLPAGWSASIRAHLARRLASLARWNEVIEIYRALAAEWPAEAEWPLRLGSALLFGAGRPSDAEAALREALQRDDGSAEAWALLGCTLAARRQFADAVSAIERAQALEAGHPSARPALLEILEAARRGESWP